MEMVNSLESLATFRATALEELKKGFDALYEHLSKAVNADERFLPLLQPGIEFSIECITTNPKFGTGGPYDPKNKAGIVVKI